MFELPKLKYAYDALEPHIDAKTMEIHHTKHHAGYVKKLNEALKKLEMPKGTSLESILFNLNETIPLDLHWDIRNNAGGHHNHTMFFDMMTPNPKDSKAVGKLEEMINKKFGSFEVFKDKFTKVAENRFGSGWTFLLSDSSNSLHIKTCANQDSPLTSGFKVILCIDVWEHAYYLKYQNMRSEYIKAWWNVVDWTFVSERYEKEIYLADKK